ncbi:MAG TPA: DUF58 domain-containing protein [Acidimicrobiales bacterium]|nr:DUF58 domain-containing protein [Acidimicrobiales bacterium]
MTTTTVDAGSEESLRRLELLVTRKLDGLLHGDHQGIVPGGGSEAGEGRLYQPGDDVRRIDWNLTARSTVTSVRDTVADRELETWLVVDGSASLDFGTADCSKRDLASAAAAAFGFLTSRSGNRLGAVVYGPEGTAVLPPRTGRDGVLRLLRRLGRRPAAPEGPASLGAALRRARLVARRRGLVVVISDLLDEDDWPGQLRALASRHEVVVVQVGDPREAELPSVGLLTVVDPETGERHEVQTATRRVRERFAAAAAGQRATAARAVRAAGAAHLELSTDRDWMLDVVRFTAARRRRR